MLFLVHLGNSSKRKDRKSITEIWKVSHQFQISLLKEESLDSQGLAYTVQCSQKATLYKCCSTSGYKISYPLLKRHLFGHTGVVHTEIITRYYVTLRAHYFQLKSHFITFKGSSCPLQEEERKLSRVSRKLSSRAGRRPHNAAPVSVHPLSQEALRHPLPPTPHQLYTTTGPVPFP